MYTYARSAMIRMGALKVRKMAPARIRNKKMGKDRSLTFPYFHIKDGRRRVRFPDESVPAMPNVESLVSPTHFLNTACAGLVG